MSSSSRCTVLIFNCRITEVLRSDSHLDFAFACTSPLGWKTRLDIQIAYFSSPSRSFARCEAQENDISVTMASDSRTRRLPSNENKSSSDRNVFSTASFGSTFCCFVIDGSQRGGQIKFHSKARWSCCTSNAVKPASFSMKRPSGLRLAS